MKTESSNNAFSAASSSSSSSSSTTMTSSSNSGNSNNVALAEHHHSGRVPTTLRHFFFQDPFFKNSWGDFEKIQEDMMKQSREFWAKVRQDNIKMVEDGNKFMEEAASNSKSLSDNMMGCNIGGDKDNLFEMAGPVMMFQPRRWMLPRFLSRDDSDKMFASDLIGNFGKINGTGAGGAFDFGADNQVIRVVDDDSKFEVSFDTHDYRPDELKVNVQGGVLSVEAKHEEKGDGKFVSRQFSRKYTLPQGCEAAKVASNLSSDGVLMITAPKKQTIKNEGGRPVPIELKK